MIESPSLRSVPMPKSSETLSPKAGSRFCASTGTLAIGAASNDAAHRAVSSRWRAAWRDAGEFKSGSGGSKGNGSSRFWARSSRSGGAVYDATPTIAEMFRLMSNAPAPSQPLTHFDSHGQAHMVDVSAKAETHRVARASGVIRMQPATLALISGGN